MEYLSNLEMLVRESAFYNDFLSRMPMPFNNLYFDTVLAVILLLYGAFRIIDGIRMMGRRKKLQRMKEEALIQSEKERQLREQEADMQKSKIAAFLQFLQMQGQGRTPGGGSAEGAQQAPAKGIGTNRFRIGSTHSHTDFERLMEEARRNEEG